MKEAKFEKPSEKVEEEEAVETKKVEYQIYPVKVPTEFGIAFRTPIGDLDLNNYLAWLGNLVLELKKGMVG